MVAIGTESEWGKSCHIDKFRLLENDQDYHAATDWIATSQRRPAIRRITGRGVG
jgi:hypothetical protein